jgi:subtilase-type serine protease
MSCGRDGASSNCAPYTAGESFSITGEWVPIINDGHGTHVTGTIGANRDGTDLSGVIPSESVNNKPMHGVSWGSDIYVANHGGSDSSNYGPYPDYEFFYVGWKALVDAGAQVINNSWGTNTRLVDPDPDLVNRTGRDNSSIDVHIWANSLAQVEYEYFYFKKRYGDNPSYVDAAWDAVKNTDVIQVFTTGNRDMVSPFHRALYPYFHPEAEQNWVAVAGIQRISIPNTSPTQYLSEYTGNTTFSEAGPYAKWWTISAPASAVISTTVNVDEESADFGKPGYGSSSGTSMAAPHVTGAMGVLLSRYQNMNALQVRDIMFTTATNKNEDGSMLENWQAGDGVPDERYGWGVPNLEKGMYGPGQFLGHVDYNASTVDLDVWTNDISETALNARELEEVHWLNGEFNTGYYLGRSYERGNSSFVVDDPYEDDVITPEDARAWRTEYATARADAIQEKIDNGLYDGSLNKRGAGTLVLTGNNSYEGGTTVQEGALYGFTESFGLKPVNVNGGLFGVLARYNDSFTMKGNLASTQARLADVNVNAGGTYALMAGQDVSVGNLTFAPGSYITIETMDTALLNDVYQNDTQAIGTVTSADLNGFDNAALVVGADYALFDMAVSADGDVITGRLSKSGSTLGSYADDANGDALAGLFENNPNSSAYADLLGATEDQLRATYDSLGSEAFLTAESASMVNALVLTRAVKNQALGYGEGQTEAISDTARIWVLPIGAWGKQDFANTDLSADFYAAVVGTEVDVSTNNTFGMFFGAGRSKYDADQYGKIDSDDLHVGLYGVSKLADIVTLNYGINYSKQDRDIERSLVFGGNAQFNASNVNAELMQFFVEAAYTGLKFSAFALEPYFGINVLNLKSDAFSESVGGHAIATEENKQTLTGASLGTRLSYAFTPNVALTGDAYYTQFFGDKEAEVNMMVSDVGAMTLKGGELKNLFGVGVGVKAQLSQTMGLSLNYIGSFNSDVQSHGIGATFKMSF